MATLAARSSSDARVFVKALHFAMTATVGAGGADRAAGGGRGGVDAQTGRADGEHHRRVKPSAGSLALYRRRHILDEVRRLVTDEGGHAKYAGYYKKDGVSDDDDDDDDDALSLSLALSLSGSLSLSLSGSLSLPLSLSLSIFLVELSTGRARNARRCAAETTCKIRARQRRL